MPSRKKGVDFNRIPIKPIHGNIKFDVYIVVDNNRSIVAEKFNALDYDTKTKIKSLINKMATVENYQSPLIKYHLTKYTYGEIKPKPHRFFFFQKYGNNFIFFDYILKKTNSLPTEVYEAIDKKREKYEKEFEEYLKRL